MTLQTQLLEVTFFQASLQKCKRPPMRMLWRTGMRPTTKPKVVIRRRMEGLKKEPDHASSKLRGEEKVYSLSEFFEDFEFLLPFFLLFPPVSLESPLSFLLDWWSFFYLEETSELRHLGERERERDLAGGSRSDFSEEKIT